MNDERYRKVVTDLLGEGYASPDASRPGPSDDPQLLEALRKQLTAAEATNETLTSLVAQQSELIAVHTQRLELGASTTHQWATLLEIRNQQIAALERTVALLTDMNDSKTKTIAVQAEHIGLIAFRPAVVAQDMVQV